MLELLIYVVKYMNFDWILRYGNFLGYLQRHSETYFARSWLLQLNFFKTPRQNKTPHTPISSCTCIHYCLVAPTYKNIWLYQHTLLSG